MHCLVFLWFFLTLFFFELEALIFGATWQIWNTTRVRVGDSVTKLLTAWFQEIKEDIKEDVKEEKEVEEKEEKVEEADLEQGDDFLTVSRSLFFQLHLVILFLL